MGILKEHGAPLAAIVGRYHGVYNRVKRAYHWDDAVSGGVIVQQVSDNIFWPQQFEEGWPVKPPACVCAYVQPHLMMTLCLVA